MVSCMTIKENNRMMTERILIKRIASRLCIRTLFTWSSIARDFEGERCEGDGFLFFGMKFTSVNTLVKEQIFNHVSPTRSVSSFVS